jgi:hypothetical protein
VVNANIIGIPYTFFKLLSLSLFFSSSSYSDDIFKFPFVHVPIKAAHA